MNNDKSKLYLRLQDAHDLFYTGLLITEDLPANERTSELLQIMDTVNARLEQILENPWWKTLS